MKDEYRVWFPDDGGSPADDITVMGARSDVDAAELAAEMFRSGPDWENHINGDPVRVCVRDWAGRTTTWLVKVETDITYTATEECAGGDS